VSETLDGLRAPLRELGVPAWLVGGSVRDALLGREVVDLDVAVQGDAAAAARRLARTHGAGRFRLSRGFGAWRVHGGTLPFPVDLTPLQGPDIDADLAGRDLTVNAMALPAAGGALHDPFAGRRDLAERRLRLVGDRAIARDPVRVVRAARLERQLGFRPDAALVAAARRDAPGLARAPGERVMDELKRLVRLPEAWRGVASLEDLGALTVIVPELDAGRGLGQNPYHHKDVLGHVIEVVRHACELADDPGPVFRGSAPRVRAALAEPLADGLTRSEALVLGALLHDMAKPATRAVTPEGRVTFLGHDKLGAQQADAWARRMRTSRRLREHLCLLVLRHLTLGFLVHRTPLSLRQIDRYLRLTAPAEVDVLVLSCADRLATRGPRTTEHAVRRHLVLAREVCAEHLRLVDRGPMPSLIGGDEVAHLLDEEPGPWIGEILDALREEQVVGRVSRRQEAERFARTWWARRGSP
jgi:putative nucleotidyltransferase with HDIG domain